MLKTIIQSSNAAKIFFKDKIKSIFIQTLHKRIWHQQICTTRYIEESPSDGKLDHHKGIKRVKYVGSVKTYFFILKILSML